MVLALVKRHPILYIQQRNFWEWLNRITNSVDESRIKDVGPDRAAAEWLLRCGAAVKWKDQEHFLKDYNSLPSGGFRNLFIEEIDATESCIMSVGFPHLRGLRHLRKMILDKCNYLDDGALPMLSAVKDSLQHLQLSSCGDITDFGVKSLANLHNLRHLLLYDLPEVKDKADCEKTLRSALPNCDVQFPYTQASDQKQYKPE